MPRRTALVIGTAFVVAGSTLLRPIRRRAEERPDVQPPAPPVGREEVRSAPSRASAASHALTAVGFLVLGGVGYALTGPPPGVLGLQLAGSGAAAWEVVCGPTTCVGSATYRADLLADLLLIIGYVVGLGLMGLLGRRYLGRASSRRLGLLAAVAVAVGGLFDLAENGAILIGLSTDRSQDLWWIVASACSVAKFVLVGLGGSTALVCFVVVVRRLMSRRTSPLAPEDVVEGRAGAAGSFVPAALGRPVGRAAVAVSGGGIRSAAVTLGALQVLREKEVLDERGYLFSVSGGGYMAGAMRLALQPGNGRTPDADPPPFAPATPEVDHLRAHGRYIADSAGQWAVAIGVVLGNFLLSMFLLAMAAVAVGAVVGALYRTLPLALPGLGDGFGRGSTPGVGWALLGSAGVAIVLWLVVGALEASREVPPTGWRAAARAAAALVVVIAVVGVVLPALAWGARWLLEPLPAGIAALAAYLVSAATSLFATSSKKASPTIPSGVLAAARATLRKTWVGLVVVLLGLIEVGIAMTVALHVSDPSFGAVPPWVTVALPIGVAVAAIVALTFDQTHASLHPFYRRRLNSAFAVRRVDGKADPYDYSEPTYLDTHATHQEGRGLPKLVLLGSAQSSDGGRTPAGLRATPYSFASDWIGGPQVGYVATNAMRRRVAGAYKQDLTLLGAMAISGAAFASSMGRESRPFQVLLALSNARLGAWMPNPGWLARETAAPDDWTRRHLPSRRREGYHVREILGRYRDDDPLLLVTDGGHYDNTALVEALRHRCRTVVAIDSSGNPPAFAEAVCDAITLARTELGVEIDLEGEAGLVPGSAADPEPTDTLSMLADRFSTCAVISGTITYPDQIGTLILAETRLTADLPYEVQAYAAQNDKFPHDPTSDQWFDHDQFDAYQGLGRHLGGKAVELLSSTGVR